MHFPNKELFQMTYNAGFLLCGLKTKKGIKDNEGNSILVITGRRVTAFLFVATKMAEMA